MAQFEDFIEDLVEPSVAMQEILDDVDYTDVDGGLVEVRPEAVTAAVGAAYQAGVTAMMHAVALYDSPDAAAHRIGFRAAMAADTVGLGGEIILRTDDVEVPSFIPGYPETCVPEGGFTAEGLEGTDRLAEVVVENLKYCSEPAWEKIAKEMGYEYGRYLQRNGIILEELTAKVTAFEKQQFDILSRAAGGEPLRQADQDDHAYVHYVDDLQRACMPVFTELTRR